jgi:hypothetical protein
VFSNLPGQLASASLWKTNSRNYRITKCAMFMLSLQLSCLSRIAAGKCLRN